MTPSGSPAWTRTATHANYGGDVNKRNLLSVGVVDAQTDVGAEELARLAADLAAVTSTAPFMVITYLNNDGTPAAPTVEVVYGMTGTTLTQYAGDAPPSGFPSAARNGNGDVTFTFASSYADDYAVSGAFAPKHAVANALGTAARIVTTELPSSTTVRVRVFNDAGAAVQDSRVSLVVW